MGTMTDSYSALAARLDLLAHRQRYGLPAGLALGILLTTLLGATSRDSTAPTDVVRATRFEMVDAEGRVRAELAIDKDGSAGMFLKDGGGGIRASLTHDAAQTALFLYDAEGTVRVGTAQFAHGGGGFALHGPKSKGAAALYLKGSGSLTFYDEEGAVTGKVPALEKR